MGMLQRLFGAARKAQVAIRTARWVVIDCETTGLDPARDRLLSIGAVAVQAGRIELADSFHAVLRQETPSAAENMLIHGIGADAQRAGRPAPEVMWAFARYLGDGLPVAFHASFDAAVVRRAMPDAAAPAVRESWLDLARLAPALFPDRARSHRSLDDWLQAFGIAAYARHDALGDAYATAQLLLVVLAEAERQRLARVGGLRRAADAIRLLAPR